MKTAVLCLSTLLDKNVFTKISPPGLPPGVDGCEEPLLPACVWTFPKGTQRKAQDLRHTPDSISIAALIKHYYWVWRKEQRQICTYVVSTETSMMTEKYPASLAMRLSSTFPPHSKTCFVTVDTIPRRSTPFTVTTSLLADRGKGHRRKT